MPRPRALAAWLDHYPGDLKAALEAARSDGFAAAHGDCAAGTLAPSEFSASARRHLTRHLAALGVSLDALSASTPAAGLADTADGERRLDLLRQTLEMARSLGVARAVASIGGFSDEKTRDRAREMLAAAASLAERTGVLVAIEPGGDPLTTAAEEIARLRCERLALAIDSGRDADLNGALRVARAECGFLRDVRRGPAGWEETPLGAGDVDFRTILGELAACGFGGSLAIRSRSGRAPVDALRRGREHVVSLTPEFR